LVETDSGGQVPDVNRANNVLASTTTVNVGFNTLQLGGSVSGTIAAGQHVFLEIDLSPGQDVQISVSTGNQNAPDLYIGYQSVPSQSNFLQSALAVNQSEESTLLKSTQAGTYFILLDGGQGVGSGTSFTLTAQQLPFGITGVSPNSAAVGGVAVQAGVPVSSFNSAFAGSPVTVAVSGHCFSPNTTASLVQGSVKVPAGNVFIVNTDTLAATFDNIPRAGAYDVVVSDQGQTATLPGAFTAIRSSGSRADSVQVSLSGPSAIRAGRVGTIYVNYTNQTSSDAPAPLVFLSGPNSSFALQGETTFTPSSISLLAISQKGPAGIIPAGESETIAVDINGTLDDTIQVGVADPSVPIDWSSLQSELQPPGMSQRAWSEVYANFTAIVGNTVGQLQTVLDNAATYLSGLGSYTPDYSQLLGFVLQQAGDFGLIDQRDTLGPLGMGMPDPNIVAVTDSSGNVSITQAGLAEPFTILPDGTYEAAPGDHSTLTRTGNTYQLRNADGTIYDFNPDGSLNRIQGLTGDQTLFAYSNQRLVSMTDSATGEATNYAYDADGRITQITDPEGRITTLTYDPTDTLLEQIQAPIGTTTFTYVSDPGSPSNNALGSITYPDGSELNFSYDNQGRPIMVSENGGDDPLTFAYDEGKVTETDAVGDTSSFFQNQDGYVVKAVDPSGNVTTSDLNGEDEASSHVTPGQFAYTAVYDALGNITSETNPLGGTVSAKYNANSELLALTDPRGNTLNYTYNSNGELTSIAYPAGTTQQFTYDPVGNVTHFVNRDGQAIDFTYNQERLLTSETFADGSQYAFTYDNHQNIVAATDPTGTTTFGYDAADRLIKVTYPGGSFLEYTYNSLGQQVQMTDQTGFTTGYSYDALGRLSKVTDGSGGLIAQYSYDAAGRLSGGQFGNGTMTDYTYIADDLVKSITKLAPDGSVQSSYSYTYDSRDLPISMTTLAGTFTYGYDADEQLISVRTPDGQDIAYQYDAAGNRVAEVLNGSATAYSTNDLDQYTGVGAATYTYNADGDLASVEENTGTTTYTYNALDQLVSVASPTAGTTNYQYDALGYLVSQTVNGQVTENLIDPTGVGRIAAQFSGSGALIAHYSYGLGLSSQTDGAGNTAYYSFDLTGNTTQLTGTSGAVLNSYSYLPFGEQLQATT